VGGLDVVGGPRAVTSRVELGPLVASTAFHNPAMLAKQAATVEAVSDGRLILGLGAGWNEREFTAFGFPFDRRVDRFAESFTVIRELTRTGRCTFAGEFVEVSDCIIHPRGPRPDGSPLLVGSIGPRMLRLTLPHVDLWNVWWSDFGNHPAGFAVRSAEVDAICEDVGRDPARSVARAPSSCSSRAVVGVRWATTAGVRSPRSAGSPTEIADRLAVAFADAGAHHVQLVVDPITERTIEHLGEVLALLDA
jgi:alkanesulfonate monooxygenase SsuD/methylene tetrahydromethanopterin reductase-like flavin-dependent oxidoreductase (luciferase family)